MSPILYAINIGTLATWLSVAGFGTFGILVPTAREILRADEKADPFADIESTVLLGNLADSDTPPSDQAEASESEEINVPLAEEETVPTPPEMPEVAEISPLPEIPELPDKPAATSVSAPTKPRVASSNKPTPRATSATGGSPQGKAESKGKTASSGGGSSSANRLAGGRMPHPSYPSEARSKGQTGTVLVEFVVGENGSVISAYAKNPCPWPILNERAVSAVRRWKFRQGSVAKFAIPIVFKLN